jgi:hypothetical protein
MRKSEVYSRRLSPHLKLALEASAREKRASVGSLLEEIVQGWLAQAGQRSDAAEAEREANIRALALKAAGSIAGGNPGRSREARQLVRRKLKRKHGR